ncbi:hypothetical protein CLAUR_016140 [Clostridium felsineum]|nr:hypothetical protein CLAUR_016140 [Clostridium felsineum]
MKRINTIWIIIALVIICLMYIWLSFFNPHKKVKDNKNIKNKQSWVQKSTQLCFIYFFKDFLDNHCIYTPLQLCQN